MDTEKLILLAEQLKNGQIDAAEYERQKTEIFRAGSSAANMPDVVSSAAESRPNGVKRNAKVELAFFLPFLLRFALSLILPFFSYFDHGMNFTAVIEFCVAFSAGLVLWFFWDGLKNRGLPYHSILISALVISSVAHFFTLVDPPHSEQPIRLMSLIVLALNVYVLMYLEVSHRLSVKYPEYERDRQFKQLPREILSRLSEIIKRKTQETSGHDKNRIAENSIIQATVGKPAAARPTNDSGLQLVQDSSQDQLAYWYQNAGEAEDRSMPSPSQERKELGDQQSKKNRVETTIYANSKYYGIGFSTIFMAVFFFIRLAAGMTAESVLASNLSSVETAREQLFYESQRFYTYNSEVRNRQLRLAYEQIAELKQYIGYSRIILAIAMVLDAAMIFLLFFRPLRWVVNMAGIWLSIHILSFYFSLRFYRQIRLLTKYDHGTTELNSQDFAALVFGFLIYIASLVLVYLYFSKSKRIQVTFGQKLGLTEWNYSTPWLPFVINLPKSKLDRIARMQDHHQFSQQYRSVDERLEELVGLRESGAITLEEYQAKRAKIIADL